jgi:hypothetical protein
MCIWAHPHYMIQKCDIEGKIEGGVKAAEMD